MEALLRLDQTPAMRRVPTVQQDVVPTIAIALFTTVVVLCVVGGFASALTLLFPVLATITAIVVFAKDKAAYVSFVFWMWFLSPLVRRLADQNSGFHPGSPVLMAPYLVSGVSAYLLLTKPGKLVRPGGIPFLLAYSGIAYGVIIGLTKFPLASMVTSIIEWVTPVTFAFFLYACNESAAAIRATILRTCTQGAFVMGIYAVYQFFFLPPWDRFWLENDHTTTFGKAEAMELRGFSTLNAPVVFALVITALLIITLSTRGKTRIFAGAAGFMGLILSFNRSAWVAFVAGASFLVWKMPFRQQRQLIIGCLGCALLSPALLTVPGVLVLVTDKLSTFTDIKQDVSYAARNEGYLRAFSQLSGEPFGEGVASPALEHQTKDNDDSIGPHDSMILELLYSLGFTGTACYLGALAIMLWRSFFAGPASDPFDSALKAILIAYIAQSLLNDFVMGLNGVIFWTSGALLMSRPSITLTPATSKKISFDKLPVYE